MSVTQVALEELAASIKEDLRHADRHVRDLATWKTTAPTGFELNAAAMLLHHLYGAIEAVVERSVKTFDGPFPDGDDSHIRLLEQGASAVDGVRPVILRRDSTIDDLRCFRHRFRKRYDVDLDVGRLHPVVKTAIGGWPHIRAQIVAFATFVDECARVAE